MTGHELSYRREDRLGRIDAPRDSGIDSYPCLATCTEHNNGPQAHCGLNQFIFAHCACGWEILCGTYIHEPESLLNGRLEHIQHQMDVLASLGLWEDHP